MHKKQVLLGFNVVLDLEHSYKRTLIHFTPDGAPKGGAIKGISFYRVNLATGLIMYARDMPEGGIEPPPPGMLVRLFHPALGIFRPVAIRSRWRQYVNIKSFLPCSGAVCVCFLRLW
jgi:hypothetical protein